MNVHEVDYGWSDEGRPEPVSFITPEHRCAAREELRIRLSTEGLNDQEINEFITFAINPFDNLD